MLFDWINAQVVRVCLFCTLININNIKDVVLGGCLVIIRQHKYFPFKMTNFSENVHAIFIKFWHQGGVGTKCQVLLTLISTVLR